MAVLMAPVALAACEQSTQELPFSTDDVVQRTIPGSGGLISTAAGAAVTFPSGTASGVQVQLQPVAAPAAASGSGDPVSQGYKLEPEGLALQERARADLKFQRSTSDAWLASVVNTFGGRIVEHGDTRVDISTGIASTDIANLGTLTVVIPPPSALIRVTRRNAALTRGASLSTARLLAVGTDSVGLTCGAPNDRCTGITVTGTNNLLDRVEDAAAVYPEVEGTLRISGGRATGQVDLNTDIRVLLQSGQTAENVTVNALLRPTSSTVVTETASQIVLTNVFFRISGASGDASAAHEETTTLVITKRANDGVISISRSFELRDANGNLENARVTIEFPVEIHQ